MDKVETPKVEHPETTELPKEKDVHVNPVEAVNSSIRRSLSTFRCRTNTCAKLLSGLQRVIDIFWMLHNFIRCHFTTRKVPAVALEYSAKRINLGRTPLTSYSLLIPFF